MMEDFDLLVELAGVARAIEAADEKIESERLTAGTYDARTILLGALSRLDSIRTQYMREFVKGKDVS